MARGLIEVYVSLIKKGDMVLDDIPEKYREQVRARLAEESDKEVN